MSHNDITGDRLASKPLSQQGRDQFDTIFGSPFCKRCDYRGTPSVDAYCLMFNVKPIMPCPQFKESQ